MPSVTLSSSSSGCAAIPHRTHLRTNTKRNTTAAWLTRTSTSPLELRDGKPTRDAYTSSMARLIPLILTPWVALTSERRKKAAEKPAPFHSKSGATGTLTNVTYLTTVGGQQREQGSAFW